MPPTIYSEHRGCVNGTDVMVYDGCVEINRTDCGSWDDFYELVQALRAKTHPPTRLPPNTLVTNGPSPILTPCNQKGNNA